MATERLQMLAAIDLARLAAIVRLAQASDSFEIDAWEVRRLSDQGATNPEGLFIFTGDGHDGRGARRWSLVLKIIQAQRPEPDLDSPMYWKRECLVMQSGVLEQMPGPLAAPRCYGIEEHPDDVWLWLEHIPDNSPRRWGLPEYAFASEQFGRSIGRSLASDFQPIYPWLARAHACRWSDDVPPGDEVWGNAYVRAAWSDQQREQTLQLWSERQRLCAALERLPQTFGHYDCNRRNLMIRSGANGQAELVAIDWAWCGRAAVGAEAGTLLANSMIVQEVDVSTGAALDEAIFAAFIVGLRLEGWDGDIRAVRLAYCANVALSAGLIGPGLTAIWTHPDRIAEIPWRAGCDAETCVAGWAAMGAIGVERGREALELIEQMGM